jgi:hypothetical protein
VRGVDELIAQSFAPPVAALWVQEIHQRGAYSGGANATNEIRSRRYGR